MAIRAPKHTLIIGFLSMLSVSAMATDEAVGFDVPAIIENGDTIPFEVLEVVKVYPNAYDRYIFEQKRKLFWKIVRDVKITLPYSKQIAAEVRKIDDATKNMSENQRKNYMKQHEDDLIDKFKPQLKRLSLRQGKLLIKLVDRECGKTSYDLVKEYRGSIKAFFWQSFATLLGANLKSGFSKEEDEVIDYIITQVEEGKL